MMIKLIPKHQSKYHCYNTQWFELDVDVVVNDEFVGSISGNYHDALNVRKIRELCGYDKVPDISQAQYKEIKLDFDEALSSVKTEDVFLYQGWNQTGSYYILGNYRISRDEVTQVKNNFSKSKLKLGQSPDNNVLCQHMMTRYFKLLKHGEFAKILLCVSLLAMYTTQLQETEYQPTFLTYVRAKFNSGKSSSAKALINPWNEASFSFEDTEAVLKQAMKSYRDMLLLLDDMSKSKRPGMINKNERIVRMAGDTTTSAQKMLGGRIDDSTVGCMALITGEDIPQLQNSSYTRMIFLEYDNNEVDWDVLTELQENPELTTWFYIRFIQNSMKSDDFISELVSSFQEYRKQYTQKFKPFKITNRYTDMCSWILAMWSKVEEFFQTINFPLAEKDFVNQCEKLILNQGVKYSHKSPAELFLTALFDLIENNKLKTVSFAEAKDGSDFDLFLKDQLLFVKSGVVYDKIRAYYEALNSDFYDSERVIRKELDDIGLLSKSRSYTTTEFKTNNNKSISGFYLLKNSAQEMIQKKGDIYNG